MGVERLVEDQEADYIGKGALIKIKKEGVKRKLVGIEFEGNKPLDLIDFWPASSNGKPVGRVTKVIWSPRLEKNIGYVWVPIELADAGNELEVTSPDGILEGKTAAIPFVDPKKKIPTS